jgi:hypothetical protein
MGACNSRDSVQKGPRRVCLKIVLEALETDQASKLRLFSKLNSNEIGSGLDQIQMSR